MVTGVACGLQNRYRAFARPGWVRFPHVPATRCAAIRTVGVLAAVVLTALTGSGKVAAQTPDTSAVSTVVGADSAGVRSDTIPPVTALGAFGRSLLLPGWGQVAVGRPERGAIYFGAEAASLFMVFKSAKKLDAAKRYNPQDEVLIDRRTRQREDWIVLSVFIAFLSGLDAWVSTHFWDFETGLVAPDQGTVGVAVSLKTNFP